MSDAAQNAYLVVVWVVLSVTCLALLNRIWPPARRRLHNDVIGWQVTVLGTIYAVMIGFMLVTVWTNFQGAEKNADQEANSLVNLFRTADGLPAEQRGELQIASVNYCDAVLNREWPTMGRGGVAHSAQPFMMELWGILGRTPVDGLRQQASLEQAMNQLSEMTEHRRIRILQSRNRLPRILWAVLIIGGVITVVVCCLIGSENVVLHFSLIVAIGLLISLALVAIADIDRPFDGSVRVSPYAFVRAKQTMLNPDINLSQ